MDTKKEMREKIADFIVQLHKAEENSYTAKSMTVDSLQAGMNSARFEVASAQLHTVMVLIEMLGIEAHFVGYGTVEVVDWGILED